MRTFLLTSFLLALLFFNAGTLAARVVDIPQADITNPYLDDFIKKQLTPIIKANTVNNNYMATIEQLDSTAVYVTVSANLYDSEYFWNSSIDKANSDLAYIEQDGVRYLVYTNEFSKWIEPTGKTIRFHTREYAFDEKMHILIHSDDDNFYHWYFRIDGDFINFKKGRGGLTWLKKLKRSEYTPAPAKAKNMSPLPPAIPDLAGKSFILPPDTINSVYSKKTERKRKHKR